MPAENKIQTQSEAEEKMVDLPDTGSAVDVEIAETKKTVNPDDDTPAVETEVETASSEEMDDYGQKVQTRIDKLTKRLREAERREQAAVQYAQGVQKEAQQQAARSNQIDTGYVTEFADRVEAQMTQAKNELKQAMDLGDVDKQVEAQSKISRLSIEQERAASHKAQRERLQQEMQAQGVDPNQPQMPQQPMPRQPAPPRQPDPKAQAWAEKNEWFGTDEPMTLTSFSIHRKLMEEGFDAQSDSYYNEVDKRMRETFPHKFEQQVSPSQTVASANRAAPGKARKGSVRLTPSQVAIAKKLGVPLQEYAKYVKE
jgi:hypothetical protein|tara:strand:- start:84 stop:1022 length:939 start_codon:yes stop_codon:yes gene_type:complete